ncbi:MAG TPA: redoxin domain-containing protein [Armatimonadaceae bacterium]|nr:redoxin domain-containing protein [Armatimonadaceae bacterium]
MTTTAMTTAASGIPVRPATRANWESPAEYNYEHFRTKHLLLDARRTVETSGVLPGDPAPDFTLPRSAGGGNLRLSDLRGKPVVLHFGSFT